MVTSFSKSIGVVVGPRRILPNFTTELKEAEMV